MFTLLPNTSAPLSGLLNPGGLQVIIFVATIVILAALAAFGVLRRGNGDCVSDGGDWGDGDSGGSCD